ncbi:MAG: hypothetical protein ACM32O_13390 [Clostridia bacterium]
MSPTCPYCKNSMRPHEFFCSTCAQDEYISYRAVKDYLRKYPSSNAMQISNATGISVSKIIKFIRDGSLTVVDRSKL